MSNQVKYRPGQIDKCIRQFFGENDFVSARNGDNLFDEIRRKWDEKLKAAEEVVDQPEPNQTHYVPVIRTYTQVEPIIDQIKMTSIDGFYQFSVALPAEQCPVGLETLVAKIGFDRFLSLGLDVDGIEVEELEAADDTSDLIIFNFTALDDEEDCIRKYNVVETSIINF